MFVIGSNSASTGYNLTRSLRFRASASAYLNRTPASASNRKTFTLSTWVKRGTLGARQSIFDAYAASAGNSLEFQTSDILEFYAWGGASVFDLATTQVFRDPSASYHVVVAVDTTQATAANRIKLYINGTQVTAFGTATYPSLNADLYINNNIVHNIGRRGDAQFYFDGYLAEDNFVDGQQLTPSSFGSTNALTGVWQPARYTGSYGTNGFYLPFTDNSALTTSSNVGLGKDFSGNGNYWTTNNISITAGVTYDSMTDVPTLTSATAANFAVLNPLQNAGSLTAANLNFSSTTTAVQNVFGTMALPPSQKIYFEATYSTSTSSGNYSSVGIATASLGLSTPAGSTTGTWAVESNQATDAINRDQGTATSYGGGTYFTTGQVCMVAVDQASGKIWWGKNGTWFSSGDPATGANAAATSIPTTATLFPVATCYGASPVLQFNFGQRPFTYTPPTGFVALNTYNLPTSTIVKGNTVMDATLWTGNGATRSIVNDAAFKPDLVWSKARSAAIAGLMYDSVRGATKYLQTNVTSAEGTGSDSLTAFNSNGFALGADTSTTGVNQNGTTYVGWQWQAGQGSTSSNTNGTITSTVSVNASAGFSVVTYTGTNTATNTVGHGLGVAPAIWLIKNRTSGSGNWVYNYIYSGAVNYAFLNSTAAGAAQGSPWSTLPTSSVVTLGGSDTNTCAAANNYVMYAWTPIAGFSAFGSYTGNGSADGPFTYLGFRPKWVMIKRTDTAGFDWNIVDTSRNTYNVTTSRLWADLSNAEDSSDNVCDITSNGFKLRSTNTNTNASGGTYIYMAFAENPFKNALAR